MNRIVMLIGLVCCTVLKAQTAKQLGPLIAADKLQEDVAVLKKQLETVHAGLYTYTTKEEMDREFLNIEEQLNHPMSDIQFYRLVAPLQQKIKNGHSMIVPSERWDMVKEKELPVFPFDVHWANNRLYVLRNLSNDESILPGSLIRTINGEPAQAVFNELIDHWTSDGNNRTYPAKHISSDFPNFYANVKGVPSSFEIVIEESGTKRTVQVAALLNGELKQKALRRYGVKRVPWYLEETDDRLSLKIMGETALLKVPTFDSSSKGSDGKKYPKFYEHAFRTLRMAEVKHLIVDLRDNGGGDPPPQLALLSHLINEPIVLYKRVFAITDKISDPSLYGREGGALNKRLAKFLQKDGEVYGLNEMAQKRFGISWEPTPPAKNVFTGKLYVLINGHSFSATGEVAGMLKTYRKDALFIGEETGGNPTQNTSGVMVFMELPHSKIRILQSLICFETNVDFENDGYGATPDYPIENSVEQVLSGVDNVLKWTLDYIKSQKRE